MKKLTRIIAVQYFLSDVLDIKVGQFSGIFGPNGCGKSSLIDAIQIVMMGANESRGSNGVSFNAQADDSNQNNRDIRSYCLGQYAEGSEHRIRNQADTYITLVWRDTETDEYTSIGVSIYATIDNNRPDIRGRYVVPTKLTLKDHLETVNGEASPRSWPSFKKMLKERSLGEEVLFKDSERFINAFLLRLRSKSGAAQIGAFRQAFRFGLGMKFDKSVDQIVRYQVLESRPTDIKRFKELLKSFQDFVNLANETKEKINDAETVGKIFKRADRHEIAATTYNALIEKLHKHEIEKQIENDEIKLKALEEKEAKVKDDVEATETELKKAKDKEKETKEEIEKHRAHSDAEYMRTQINKTERDYGNIKREFNASLKKLHKTLLLLMPNELITNNECQIAANRVQTLIDDDLAYDEGALKEALASACKAVKKRINNEVIVRLLDENATLTEVEGDIKTLKENMVRLRHGKRALPKNVTELKRLLADQGIETLPVCDLVKIDDESWQAMIEAYLGQNNMLALLVNPSDEREAFKIVRESHIENAKLARVSHFKDRESPKLGSVAELISGQNQSAVNYLRSKLGPAMRADSEDEVFQHDFAMTKDGMILNYGEIIRLGLQRSKATFLLGPVTEDQRAHFAKELAELETKKEKLDRVIEKINLIREELSRFANEQDCIEGATAQFSRYHELKEDLTIAKNRLAQLDTEGYKELCDALKEVEKLIEGIGKTKEKLTFELGSAKNATDSQRVALESNKNELKSSSEKLAQLCENDLYDEGLADKKWLEIINEHFDIEQQKNDLQQKKENEGKFAVKYSTEGQNKLQNYCSKYVERLPEGTNSHWRKMHKWIEEREAFLRDTQLADNEQRLEEALNAAQETFRNDVAMRINENIEHMQETIERLNASLRKAPLFTNNERYEFKRVIRPQHKALYEYIKNVATYGSKDDLFGGAGAVPKEFEDLMVESTATRGQTPTPLDDYREFYNFDIEIKRVNQETGESVKVGNLSKRIGSGSGGEHRAPLYVIAGAALSSAYRINSTDQSGLRLIVIDEAFMRMDPTNITTVMQYFKDLGLQVFMASTIEKIATLTADLDIYYDVMRDSERNVIEFYGHDVSAETQILFQSDSPDLHPELIDDYLAKQQAEQNTQGAVE